MIFELTLIARGANLVPSAMLQANAKILSIEIITLCINFWLTSKHIEFSSRTFQ